jgi:hypothetical protein
MSPVIEVTPVVVIAVFARMTKLPADNRLTAAGPAAKAAEGPERPNKNATARTESIERTLIIFIVLFLLNNGTDYLPLIIRTRNMMMATASKI